LAKKKKKKKKKKKGDLGTQSISNLIPLHEAIEAHRLDIVQYLLKEKSCVNETNMYGDHALLCAVKSHAPISILESLLKAKADIMHTGGYNRWNAFACAAAR